MISTRLFTIMCTLVLGFVAEVKFNKVYSFGDSISDNGNFFNLLNKQQPDVKKYFKGRFSNGPVWVEYLSDNLGAKLTDLAYGSATTDNESFPALYVRDGVKIPGCIQQVDSFLKNYKRDPKDENKSLVTMAFMGNDFLHLEANAKTHVENQKACLDNLLKGAPFKNILIATSNAPEIYPVAKDIPFFVAGIFFNKNAQIPGLWDTALEKLMKDHTGVNFYSFDFRGVVKNVADGKTLLSNNTTPAYKQTACLGKDEALICPNPDNSMFWDSFHPTTALHKLIAMKAQEIVIKSM